MKTMTDFSERLEKSFMYNLQEMVKAYVDAGVRPETIEQVFQTTLADFVKKQKLKEIDDE